MIKVTVELRGLVDLVSDGSEKPGRACLLMPNAEVPDASRIPKLLRFRKPHTARLLIVEGERSGGVYLASPPPRRCGGSIKGISLMGKEVVLKPELNDLQGQPVGLRVAREPTTDPPGSGTEHSAEYLGDLDDLLAGAGEDLGGIDPNLKGGYGAVVAEWLAARVVLTSGKLMTTALWKDGVKGHKKVAFQMRPPPPMTGGPIPVPEVYMAGAMCLVGTVDAAALRVCLTTLSSGHSAGELVVEPVGSEIHLIIENAPEDCMHHDAHFLAHYWLREGRDRVKAVLVPSVAGWAHGAGSDPQCSPGDNNG